MDRVTVRTDAGDVAGEQLEDLTVFRGIPFAAPPVGDRRFRAPQPVEPWVSVRDAIEPAPVSLQPPPDAASTIPGDPDTQSEDCLYLNVVTPGCDDRGRAVMVWIHGGGFVSGSPSSGLYRGDRLAREGVVVVNVGYRLGALGWLAHPALADPAAPDSGFGNWGLLDQIAALEWVQRNIAAFGGDPERVTVFGESAGGISVAALLATHAAGRLFRQAIIESGAAMALGEGSAARVAEELAGELGIAVVSREALLKLPGEEILRAQIAVGPRYEVLGLPLQPVIDGGVLTAHPAALIAAGSGRGVRVVIGTNRDEWRFWTLANPELGDLDDERQERLVARSIDLAGLTGRMEAAPTIECYRAARAERGESVAPTDLHCALSTDWVFRVPSMRLVSAPGAGFEAVFAYLFDWESPFGDGVLGSCHALELPFVFGTCDNPFVQIFSGGGEEAERLSAAMRSAWTSFATTGDPSSSVGGEWPAYTVPERATKRFGRVVEVVTAPMEPERAWIDEAWGPYGEHESAVAERVRVPGRGS